jgi:hypothetical protein
VHAALIADPRSHGLFDRLVGVQRRMNKDGPAGRPVHQQHMPPPNWPGRAVGWDPGAAPSGDRRQADYFVRLLALHQQRIDRRIRKCQDAIVLAEVAGDIENVFGFRQLLAVEQQERQAIEGMIANLRRRFCG